MSWIEWSATLLGIVYVVLMIRRNILCWIAGNISVALQAISFYGARLYADMVLQGVYFVLGCYGFFQWWRTPSRHSRRPIARIKSRRIWVILSLIWIIVSSAWAFVLRTFTNAVVPEIDAALAVASLVATWMQVHRYIENWLFWMAIDTAYIALYWSRGLYLYAILFFVFVVLAWRGWVLWFHQLRPENALIS